jgi:hypothetical protein
MKTFIYYHKSDPNKEIISKFSAIDLEDATKIAAHIKQLPEEEFLKLFEIHELI